jgi:hypothetical protein
VFFERDFTDATARIQRITQLLADFRFLLNRNHPVNKDGAQLQKLLAEPEVAAFLARQQKRQTGG